MSVCLCVCVCEKRKAHTHSEWRWRARSSVDCRDLWGESIILLQSVLLLLQIDMLAWFIQQETPSTAPHGTAILTSEGPNCASAAASESLRRDDFTVQPKAFYLPAQAGDHLWWPLILGHTWPWYDQNQWRSSPIRNSLWSSPIRNRLGV